MSTTDDLRRMLDERGVEYHEYQNQLAGSMEPTTTFYIHDDEHKAYASIEVGRTNVLLTLNCTPEQAIAATLGSEVYIPERTCRCTTDDNAWCFACSECGKTFPRSDLRYAHNHGEINYCPNCGLRVTEDEE